MIRVLYFIIHFNMLVKFEKSLTYIYGRFSSPSISDEDIDFNFVYALHTFVATVEGQANVIKGDTLILLDDSNSYWWLVRLAKDQTVGYLPAEHIETPLERLARLNKYRNAEISSITVEERENDSVFYNDTHVCNKDNKLVVFSVPTYIEYAEGEWDDNSKCTDDDFEISEECEIHNYINENSDNYDDDIYTDFNTSDDNMIQRKLSQMVLYDNSQNVSTASDMGDVIGNSYCNECNVISDRMSINKCKRKSKGKFRGISEKNDKNEKEVCKSLGMSCDNLETLKLGNNSQVHDAFKNGNIKCNITSLSYDMNKETGNYENYDDDSDNIYIKSHDSDNFHLLNDIKNDTVLETSEVYNKNIYLSKGALRVYFDERKDSELYFSVNSMFSFDKNENIIYPEIHELYVNIEFELEKISQFAQSLFKRADSIICCCGKCYSASIVSPICTIRIERTEYLLDEPTSSLDLRGIDDMAYCEIMEPIKRMEKLCHSAKKWLKTFNSKKKGFDNIFRFQDYVTDNYLNMDNRPKSSTSLFKIKIPVSILRYRRSWPNHKKIY
ncbi:hypothetical protein MERGE_000483 [Pneumocystis wakefieldiae]|uniref:SH3 domain-containing protein n=1 Tax=Pneumocystis wakefieldiae TaxID=38082 RepID=A0A899G446_9ASCO|nr:hypothetical protein MERGE_000483 [Pneumocystis wakefieldiae]